MGIVDLGPAARRLAGLIARAGDGDLGRPTPCPRYSLGDLIDHIGGLSLVFTAAARKDGGPYGGMAPSGDVSRLGPDWRDRIPRDLGALAQAWSDPAAWSGTARIADMDMPAGMTGLTVADELAVHGWDVARALGEPYDCDVTVLAAAQVFLEQFASPDAPAGPDVPFGPSRQVPDGAPLLDRVVARAGRDPAWAPLTRPGGPVRRGGWWPARLARSWRRPGD